MIKKIPWGFRTDDQRDFLQIMREKYENGCPSYFYPAVSKKLQENYKLMHEQICLMLYD